LTARSAAKSSSAGSIVRSASFRRRRGTNTGANAPSLDLSSPIDVYSEWVDAAGKRTLDNTADRGLVS
jgi:hypothetical protein